MLPPFYHIFIFFIFSSTHIFNGTILLWHIFFVTTCILRLALHLFFSFFLLFIFHLSLQAYDTSSTAWLYHDNTVHHDTEDFAVPLYSIRQRRPSALHSYDSSLSFSLTSLHTRRIFITILLQLHYLLLRRHIILSAFHSSLLLNFHLCPSY